MNTRFLAILTIVFLFTSSSIFAGEKIMYKWTDDKGEIHYTERAPKGVEYTRIRTYVDSSSAAASKTPQANNPADSAKKKDTYGTWRDENCTIANQNLDVLKNASRIGVDDGQGGKRLMSDEEKNEKIAQMQKQRDKYCNAAAEDK